MLSENGIRIKHPVCIDVLCSATKLLFRSLAILFIAIDMFVRPTVNFNDIFTRDKTARL